MPHWNETVKDTAFLGEPSGEEEGTLRVKDQPSKWRYSWPALCRCCLPVSHSKPSVQVAALKSLEGGLEGQSTKR